MHRAALGDLQRAAEIENSRELNAELRKAQEMLRACIRRAPKVTVPIKVMSSVELPPLPHHQSPIQTIDQNLPPSEESDFLSKEESVAGVNVRETKGEVPKVPQQKVSLTLVYKWMR